MQSTAMNTERINELLERYYEALTTEAEEEELRRCFAEGEVPAHLMGERELFLQLQAAASGEVSVPDGLEERLETAIDGWAAQEEDGRSRRGHIYQLRLMGRVAAAILALLAFGWYLYEPIPMRKDTCATPEEAYAEAHEALMQFALALDRGTQQIAMVHSTTEKIEESISEYLTLTIE